MLLSALIFRELYGYETSELCLLLNKKKYIKSFDELRMEDQAKR